MQVDIDAILKAAVAKLAILTNENLLLTGQIAAALKRIAELEAGKKKK